MNADESGGGHESIVITRDEYDHVVHGVACIAWAEGHRAGIADATSVPRTGMTYAVTENPYALAQNAATDAQRPPGATNSPHVAGSDHASADGSEDESGPGETVAEVGGRERGML